MSITAVMDAYRSAYFQCKLDGDKVPPGSRHPDSRAGVEGDAGVGER